MFCLTRTFPCQQLSQIFYQYCHFPPNPNWSFPNNPAVLRDLRSRLVPSADPLRPSRLWRAIVELRPLEQAWRCLALQRPWRRALR